MQRIRLGILALALGLCATPVLGAQQTQPTEGIRFGVGGGLTLPMGNYADVDKAGWHVMGLIQFPISQSPIHARFDAMYGQTSRKAPASGNTTLTGATGDLVYHLGNRASTVRPYVVGGLGFYNVDGGGGSDTKFAFGAGGGILFSIGTMHAFLETRYMSIQRSGSSYTFLPVTLGLMFGQ
jgi:hypothetical protein